MHIHSDVTCAVQKHIAIHMLNVYELHLLLLLLLLLLFI